jgi:anti-sigma regulatory factor (Ser/Thr protein kinase)
MYFTANVQIRTTFTGTVVVEAKDEEEAEKIIVEDEDFEFDYEDMEEKMGPDIQVANIRRFRGDVVCQPLK